MRIILILLFILVGGTVNAEAREPVIQYCDYWGGGSPAGMIPVNKKKSTFVNDSKCKIIDKRENEDFYLKIIKHIRTRKGGDLRQHPGKHWIRRDKLEKIIDEDLKIQVAKKEPTVKSKKTNQDSEANIGKGMKTCEGFCKGEELIFDGHADRVAWDTVVNGKKKKIKFQHLDVGVRVKNSTCVPFLQSAVLEPKNKNKDALLGILSNNFTINTCAPCPPDFGVKTDSGYCPLLAYGYLKLYDKAFKYGIVPPMGIEDDAKVQENGLLIEIISFQVNTKKDLVISKWFSKNYNKLVYVVETSSFKTALKQQIIKNSEKELINDEELKTVLDNFISRIGSSYNSKGLNKDEKTKKLYNSLPTNEEIDVLIENFSELEEFHIQTRN